MEDLYDASKSPRLPGTFGGHRMMESLAKTGQDRRVDSKP
jgi:hypothetical protein